MRSAFLIFMLSVPLAAQNLHPSFCTGIALDVDARCGCVKDPNGEVCRLVKTGIYEPHDYTKTALGDLMNRSPAAPTAAPGVQPSRMPHQARPQQARVVPLAHKDYLRFLHPNARLAAGFDFEKLSQSDHSQEWMTSLFAQPGDEDSRNKVMGALKEMDHLWLSFASPTDFTILMTGRFEQGVATGMFYSQGVSPVFLGGAHAMIVGPEPSVQAALARLAAPPNANGGWVARHARELSKDHETWVVNELPPGTNQGSDLQAIRQFSLGFRLSGNGSVDGEAVADSEAGAEKIAAWVDQMKTALGALDSLTVERAGATLRFAAKGEGLLAGEAGKTAMNSDLGVQLYTLMMTGFPGAPARTVAGDKLVAVKIGMKQEEVVRLLGKPLTVSGIQGLDTPRETWTYQIAFGKQVSLRLDGGVVTAIPR